MASTARNAFGRRGLRAVGLAVACAAGLVVAAPASALEIVAAEPRWDRGDVATGSLLRVTVSPNGDGLHDVATVGVVGTPGAAVRLADARGAVVATGTLDGTGAATLAWIPSAGTGWAVLRACEDGGACSPQRVHVQRRTVAVALLTPSGAAPGAVVPVAVSAERPVRLWFEDLSLADPQPVAERTVAPGDVALTVPPLRAGLWALVVATAADERAIAPLVVEAPHTGTAAAPATLVVVPTLTIRAYDRGDADRDGRGDSWYLGERADGVPIVGQVTADPRGAPWRAADRLLAGLRFLRSVGVPFDVVSDVDLPRLGAGGLDAYRVVAFVGHEEYYTLPMWRTTLGYRNRGGRLWFMQANSFYTRVGIADGRMRIVDFAHRTPARSDYMLAGAGYVGCCWSPARPVYRVAAGAPQRVPWLFAGTGLGARDVFGYALGEADAISRRLSPRGTVVIAAARLPSGARSHVTYYEGPHGSEVLDLGTVAALEQLESPRVPLAVKATYRRMMLNVWRRLRRP